MTINLPLVSVIIPTYNQAHFLKEALESVLAQTYSNWEAIVINNFSQDNTISVVETYSDTRIRLVNFHNYGVIASSRNEGIRCAKGEFVAFLDSDDIWKPLKLERCIDKLISGYDMVFHSTIWFWDNGRTRNVPNGPEKRARYQSLLYFGNCIATSATIVRKIILDTIGGFSVNPDYITAEDYDLWLRITKITEKVSFIPELLSSYRIHTTNFSKGNLINMKADLAVVTYHFNQVTILSTWEKLKQNYRYALCSYRGGREMQSNSEYMEALRFFFKSLKKSPILWKNYIVIIICFFEMIKLLFHISK